MVSLRREIIVPLRIQLERGLREAIQQGRLSSGSMMPSTRVLAAELGLSRGVVVDAYEQLLAEGIFVLTPRLIDPCCRPAIGQELAHHPRSGGREANPL
jgi:DNA-binding transcriptional MocR family regulator